MGVIIRGINPYTTKTFTGTSPYTTINAVGATDLKRKK